MIRPYTAHLLDGSWSVYHRPSGTTVAQRLGTRALARRLAKDGNDTAQSQSELANAAWSRLDWLGRDRIP